MPELVDRNCIEEADDFQRGHFDETVAYLLPANATPPVGLHCTSLTTRILACRNHD